MAAVNSINFLRKKRAKVTKYQQWDRYFAQGAGAILLVCLLLTGGLFGYWRYITSQITAVKEQQKTQQRVVAQASSNEAQYVVYTHRLTTIGGLLQARTSKLRALRFLSFILRPGVSFEGISYDTSSKQLKFRAKAGQVFDVQSLLQALREPDISSQIATLELADIRRGEDADYTIDISIVLKEEK